MNVSGSGVKPIGLLFDAVSNNTGDRAIGISLKGHLDVQGVPAEIVDPYDFRAEDYAALLIGGGFLLRDPGDPFYDKFRVPGNHMLNAVGTSTSQDLDYLKQYSKVSVRSQKDRERLRAGLPDVPIEVVPDSTVLLQPVELPDVHIPPGSVGIHVVADTLRECDGLQRVLDSIAEPKVVIPFTHYNYDLRLMTKMNVQGDYHFLDELSPRELFTVIGRMKYVIVSSLHATIFAYTQNVPFLTFYQDKVHDYLVDRGLEQFIFRNTQELREKMHLVTDTPPDFTDMVARDKEVVTRHLEEFIAPYRPSTPSGVPPLRDVGYHPPRGSGYTKESLILDLHKDVLAHRDDLVHELIVRNDRQQQVDEGLRRQLAAVEQDRTEVRQQKQAVERRLSEAERRLQDLENSRAHQVAAQVERRYAKVRDLQKRVTSHRGPDEQA